MDPRQFVGVQRASVCLRGPGPGRDAAGALPEDGEGPTNTFTFSQRAKMKRERREPTKDTTWRPQLLDPKFAEGLRARSGSHGANAQRKSAATSAWMAKLAAGDYSGPILDSSRYLALIAVEV